MTRSAFTPWGTIQIARQGLRFDRGRAWRPPGWPTVTPLFTPSLRAPVALTLKLLKILVTPTGFEPVTLRLGI
jgi:hypothetical protein